jgi:acyl-CoA reductase-like NAD-dependent aldehyde dehydrogenase
MNTSDIELNQILQNASAARASFARQEPRRRYEQLTTIAERLDANADDLVAVAMEETQPRRGPPPRENSSEQPSS